MASTHAYVPATLPCADKRHDHSSSVNAAPLSSTFIDVGDHTVADIDAVDNVVVKLFTQIQRDGLHILSFFFFCYGRGSITVTTVLRPV